MIEIENKDKCCGCHSCFNVCPKSAIEMKEDEYGFKYPQINRSICINCGLCEKVCPIVNKKQGMNEPIAYACFNKDENIRLESSSGGVFSAIADHVLKLGGVIYGAAFDDKWLVKHIRIDSKEDLWKLRTSKYLQSMIGNTYKMAKKDLNSGVKVLFTGTPCQVNGFLTYLDKKYDNLYTQDIICHGVPSPKVWKKYLEYSKQKYREELIKVNFRQKDNGWNLYSLLLQYKDKVYNTKHNKDLFMQAFLRNTCLRDSCYNCSFKDKNRITDITLADFWGINNIEPKINDNKGISLVIINSKKGEVLLNNIKDKLIMRNVDFDESIKYNTSMIKSAPKPIVRDEFFFNLDKIDFKQLVGKYTEKEPKDCVFRRVLRKIKKIIISKRA